MSKELLNELRKKKRMRHFWKEGQVSLEMLKGIARSCRKKIREAEVQIDLNLATSLKHNKKYFYEYTNGKRKDKDNLYSLPDARGNLVTKDEEKEEYLILSLPQFLIERQAALRTTVLLGW